LLRAYRADGFTNRDAVDLHATLIRLPNIRVLPEPPDLETLWHQLAALPTASPKVWMDAYLAAFAIRHKVELATFDGDFKRFVKDGLKLKLLTRCSRSSGRCCCGSRSAGCSRGRDGANQENG
jgi:predicted nucleic acid-binding protein